MTDNVYPEILQPQDKIQIPTMLTIQETANLFHLSYFFVRRAVVEGKVPYVKTGKKYLINAERFTGWLNNGDPQRQSPEEPIDCNDSKVLSFGRVRQQA